MLRRDGTQRNNEVVHKFLQGKEAQIQRRYRMEWGKSIENFAMKFLRMRFEKAWGVFSGDGVVGGPIV